MPHPAELQVEHALDELVNQFSDPLSFLRELVQNALDAGSSEVEIRVTHEPAPGAGESGFAVVHVDDFGEGMTREIIEKRLTRLFSSAKDGDKTKIGKFGIGFVSVFAIEPEAVCIDTSREGENWRILFDAQRRYKLIRRDEPVDGTKIRIYKAMEAAEVPPFSARARAVVEYWCKHTRGEVRFDDELVNRPLDLEAGLQVDLDDGFSRILVGHPDDGRPFFGFYNSGLTLEEGTDAYYDAVAFKVSSPHLEHTLTRDSVIHDEGYHRVLRNVQAAIDGPLCARVWDELERRTAEGAAVADAWVRAANWHAGRPGALERLEARSVFRAPDGRRLTVEALQGRHRRDRVLTTEEDGPLARALLREGLTVVHAPPDGARSELLRSIVPPKVEVRAIKATYAMPLPPRDDVEVRAFAPLAGAVRRLIDACGLKIGDVAFGHFRYPDSAIASLVAITQREFGQLSELEDVTDFEQGFFGSRRTLVVNADHGAVADLVALSSREPDFAAYLLAKLFFLGERLDAALDGQLARHAMTGARG